MRRALVLRLPRHPPRPARSTPWRFRSEASSASCAFWAIGVALIDQAARCLVAITQRRRQKLGAVPSHRAAGNSLETLQQPDPFRLVAGLDADRLDLRPVVFEIFAKNMFLLVVKVCK